MSNDDRPLSPHLQIYRWQVTMLLSILHRLSGVGLAFGAVLITWWLMATVTGEPQFNAFHAFARTFIGRFMLFGWVWAFCFHFMNGIRHLVWDTGRGFTKERAASSAWFVLLASLALSSIVWFMGGGVPTK